MQKFFFSILILLVLSSLGACSQDPSTKAQTVTVYAAVSLSNALDEINALYQQQYDTVVHTSYASSGTLAKQIQSRAPAEVFLSADTTWMDNLANKNYLVEGSQKNLLTNRLVLITPKDKPVPLNVAENGLFDPHLFQGKLCIGNPQSVPAGKYAKEAFTYLGIWDGLLDKLVETQDVRSALNFVHRGECQLGVVYLSDVTIANTVQIVAIFPKDSHRPITYPLAMIKNDHQNNLNIKSYYDFIQSANAITIYKKYGFEVLP